MPVLQVPLANYVAELPHSPLAAYLNNAPWRLTAQAAQIVRRLLTEIDPAAFVVHEEVAVHRTAKVEPGAVLKGPLILGPQCFVASGAYLRGGNWLAERCIIGPGAELKSSFVFAGTKLAHFNFVGDSILGVSVNLEAGSVICNYRNERSDKEIRVRLGTTLHGTGCRKFGALVGDHCRIGANAVIAPGALIPASSVVPRGEVHDEEMS